MNNDQEWRTHLFDEIKELRNDIKELKGEMMNLKIKVASFSAFIGSVVSVLINKLME